MVDTFSTLLSLIYAGPTEEIPWQGFVENLRLVLQARNVIVTLHHIENEGSDVYVMASIPGDTIDWAAVEATYRTEFMDDDPIHPDRMVPGQLGLTGGATLDGRRRAFHEELGITHTLRACFSEPGGIRCWLDVVRGRDHNGDPFTPKDLALLRKLLPHLTQALGLYAKLKRQEAEKVIYESMVDHFSLGCVLLNEAGEVIHINAVATSIVDRWPGISVSGGRLVLTERLTQEALNNAIGAIIAARKQGNVAHGGELGCMRGDHGQLLGLLVYPAPLQHYYRGGQAPCVIVYLSDLTANLEALRPSQTIALDRVGKLFGLTRQESALALLLAYGHSIADAARDMRIAESAARNYSKKIYAKMGITSQTDLVRLVLRSFSFLR